MNYLNRILVGTMALISGTIAGAAENCFATVPYNVQKLSDLPGEIRQILAADLPGVGGIAEKGAQFNSTDVIIRPLPMRRFQAASLSHQCAIVNLERGVRGHYSEEEFFEYVGGHWRQAKLP